MNPDLAPPPLAATLAHVDTWVFDLDNTLYPVACGPYPQIDQRIRDFIARALGLDAEEARRRQKRYFHTYGTSLLGMSREHGTEPRAFLDYVHDVDLTCIPADRELDAALAALPGRKIVFTNADSAYSERVLARIGIRAHFEAIFDIEAADYLPKPHRATYERMLVQHRIDPRRSAMVEDLPRNLAPAAALGMTTVWIRNDGEWASRDLRAIGAERPSEAPPDDRQDALKRQFASDGASAQHIVDHLPSWLRQISVR